MKLIGSRTESEFREELVRSRVSLFSEPGKQRLLDALRSVCPDLNTGYVIGWTPEQGEDLYRVLVDGATVVAVEVDRTDLDIPPDIKVIPVAEYQRGLSRSARIRLAVATDLLREEDLANE